MHFLLNILKFGATINCQTEQGFIPRHVLEPQLVQFRIDWSERTIALKVERGLHPASGFIDLSHPPKIGYTNL